MRSDMVLSRSLILAVAKGRIQMLPKQASVEVALATTLFVAIASGIVGSGCSAPRPTARDTFVVMTKIGSWPSSDQRLDTAISYDADMDPARFESIGGMPLILAVGVRDLGHIRSGYILHYDWSEDCSGSTDRGPLDARQINFIRQYNASFFDDPDIDNPKQYKTFVEFLERRYSNTLMGSYLSAISSIAGKTTPYAEHFYPQASVDYYDFGTGEPRDMGTQPFLPRCSSRPAAWVLNVANEDLAASFRAVASQIIRDTDPRPDVVFLDNATYLHPEFRWTTGEKDVDCRDSESADNPDCRAYREAVARELGPGLYQSQFIDHYAQLIADLNNIGVRSILNVGVPGAVLGCPRERAKYTKQLSDAIGQNGISFEQPFVVGTRSNAPQTNDEIDVYKQLLSDGKLLVLFADYNDAAQSSWFAAMAMLLRNPGDALFVARDLTPALSWAYWPDRYGAGHGDATFQQVGLHRGDVGDNWRLERNFDNGHITSSHLGIRQGESFDLAQLVPAVADNTYVLVDAPQLGTWNATSHVYSGTSVGVDHFTLGSNPDSRGYWRNLVTVSAQVWPSGP